MYTTRLVVCELNHCLGSKLAGTTRFHIGPSLEVSATHSGSILQDMAPITRTGFTFHAQAFRKHRVMNPPRYFAAAACPLYSDALAFSSAAKNSFEYAESTNSLNSTTCFRSSVNVMIKAYSFAYGPMIESAVLDAWMMHLRVSTSCASSKTTTWPVTQSRYRDAKTGIRVL